MTNSQTTEAGQVGEQKRSKLVRYKVYFDAEKYIWAHEDKAEEEAYDLLWSDLASFTDEYLESLDIISVEKAEEQ